MKKERIYSAVYGLVLALTLIATTVMGQVAYNTAQPSDVGFETEKSEKLALNVVNVNTAAIITISNHLKAKISDVKERVGIDEKGTWIVELTVTKNGEITSTSVSRNDRVGKLIFDIVSELEEVEPITYNGVAKEKTIQIPVILASN